MNASTANICLNGDIYDATTNGLHHSKLALGRHLSCFKRLSLTGYKIIDAKIISCAELAFQCDTVPEYVAILQSAQRVIARYHELIATTQSTGRGGDSLTSEQIHHVVSI